jgi:hypothetical protein
MCRDVLEVVSALLLLPCEMMKIQTSFFMTFAASIGLVETAPPRVPSEAVATIQCCQAHSSELFG